MRSRKKPRWAAKLQESWKQRKTSIWKKNQQETMWQSSAQAPLAQLVESSIFNQTVKVSNNLWGENSPFSHSWKQENIKTLSRLTWWRTNLDERQTYKSPKNMGERSSQQQGTTRQASVRAPPDGSLERRWSFNPAARGASPLWGKKLCFHKLETVKYTTSE